MKKPNILITCLAAEYIRVRMGLPCLATIRHPAATAESWRRLGWCPDLRQFWEQPLLWDRHLQEIVGETGCSLYPDETW
jgi:hypothetical protein